MRIHSKHRFSDSLIISSGTKNLELLVDLDLTSAAQAIRKAREVLAVAQQAALKNPSAENMEAFGRGLRMLVVSVFGTKQATKIIDFYDDRAEAMLDDIMPYILNKIAPIVIRYSSNRRKELEKLARQNAKRRRK